MSASVSSETTDTDITYAQVAAPHLRLLLRIVWFVVVGWALIAIGVGASVWYAEQVRYLETTPRLVEWAAETGLSTHVIPLFFLVGPLLATLFFLGIAVILFRNFPDNWLAVEFSLALVLLAPATNGLFANAGTVGVNNWHTWLILPLWYGAVLLTTPLPYILPDSHFVPRWGKWLLLVYFVWELIRGQQWFLTGSTEPLGLLGWNLPLFIVIGIGFAGQVKRYRRGAPVYRQQVKWMVYGLGVWGLLFGITILYYAFLPPLETPSLRGFLTEVFFTNLTNLGSVIMALTVGIAMTRYRLWDINLVINRSLVFGAVSFMVAIPFVLIFLIVQPWLARVLGSDQSALSGAAAALIAIALFNPARRQAQHVIDRRFYGLRFDLNELAEAQALPRVTRPGALTGQMLGPYQILDVLGKGGMGEVYKGIAEGHLAAIKILAQDLAGETEYLARFEREAETLAALDHPNIIKVYTAGETDGVYFLAMEYIDGEELEARIEEAGALPVDEVQATLGDLAAALDYAHSQGLVHRDIKPSNVMLEHMDGTGETRAILMDFGIAKVQNARTALTGTGAIGTIEYMAPEQVMESREVDHRADIYALGVVLYEMLTGERPFKGGPAQVMFAHLQQPAPDPRDLVPEMPRHIAKAVLKALEKEPDKRFQSAGELCAAMSGPGA